MLSKEAAQQLGECQRKKESDGDSSTPPMQQQCPSGGTAKPHPFIPGLQESQHKDGHLNIQVDTRISCPREDGFVNIWKKYLLMKIQWSTWPDPLYMEISVLVFA